MSSAPPTQNFPQLSWDTDCLKKNQSIRSLRFPLRASTLKRTYPTRILRYWFGYHFLRLEHERLGRPIDVCEVGIDIGQMLMFMNSVAEIPGIPPVKCSSWIGVDCKIQQQALAGLGYTQCLEADIEQSDSWLNGNADAIVMLHVLEHLYHPEKTLALASSKMKPGSVLIGGFPSVPNWCAGIRERQIRPHPNANGHVSVFSPTRVRKMAQDHGLELEFLTGAFFLRASGSFLEDYQWWLRFNLAFGRLFPAWPGEIYWVMRKPDRLPTPSPAATRAW